MEDPKWLRLVTIGLVLAAVAVGYFLLSGRFASNAPKKTSTQISQASPTPTISPVPAQTPAQVPAAAAPSPTSAYDRIAQRTNETKGGQSLQTLPRTGFPVGAVAALSASAVLIGWGLRRFPR